MKKKQPVKTEEDERPRDFVSSLVHGLNVLGAFAGIRPRMTLTEVAEMTDMTRAGARRYLLTLAHLGYLAKDGREFRLTPKVLELGYAYLAGTPLWGLAQPFLDELTETIVQSSALSVLDGRESVYIAQSTAERMLSVRVPVGRRLPALYTSAGRIILAHMSEEALEKFIFGAPLTPFNERSIRDPKLLMEELHHIRAQGFCVLDQEVEIGIRTVAVPILNPSGEVEAAAIILTDIATVSTEMLTEQYLPALRKAAKNIQESLHALPLTPRNLKQLEIV